MPSIYADLMVRARNPAKRIALWMVVLLTTGPARAELQFQTLSFPGASSTAAYGINDQGQIVGSYGGGSTIVNSFLLDTNGTYTQTSIPGAHVTYPSAINNMGQTVGEYETGSGSVFGYLQNSNGSYLTISAPAVYMAPQSPGSTIRARWSGTLKVASAHTVSC